MHQCACKQHFNWNLLKSTTLSCIKCFHHIHNNSNSFSLLSFIMDLQSYVTIASTTKCCCAMEKMQTGERAHDYNAKLCMKVGFNEKVPMNGNNHNKKIYFHLSKPPSLRPLCYPLCLQRNTALPSTWNENPSIFLTYNNSKDSTRYSCKNSSERQKRLSFEIFREFFFSIFFISVEKKNEIVYDVVFHRGEKESLEATSNKILKGRRKKKNFGVENNFSCVYSMPQNIITF